MKIFLIFATALGFIVSAHAQTTIQVTVSGQAYDLTYRSTVSYDDYASTIDDAPWHGLAGGGESTAQTWADAADVNNLRFAFNKFSFGGGTAVYSTNATTLGNPGDASSSANGIYAINAVAVPAPLPILGILPVGGFLKRMRRRQKAS